VSGLLLFLSAACATGGPAPLAGITWQWRVTRDGQSVVQAPRPGHAYLLNFRADKLTGRVDCNRLNGGYRVQGSRLHFFHLATTRAFCGKSRGMSGTCLIWHASPVTGAKAGISCLFWLMAGKCAFRGKNDYLVR